MLQNGEALLRKVKGQRYLYQRGGKLIFRRGVPGYARETFGNRCEVQTSLRTENIAEARYLVLGETRKFEHLLSKARQSVANPNEPAQNYLPSSDEIEQGVLLWYSERFARSPVHDLIDNPDPDAARSLDLDLTVYSETVARTMLPTGSGSDLNGRLIAQSLIERYRWDITEGSPLFNRLLRVVKRGQVQLSKVELQELRGLPQNIEDNIFSPDRFVGDLERQKNEVTNAPVSIMGLFDGYVHECQPKARTVTAWRRQIRAFIEFLSHDDAQAVDHGDLVRWKEHLLQKTTRSGETLNARTVRDTYMSAIKAVFRWAKRNAKIDVNPTSDVHIRVSKRTKTRDRSLSDQEALLILRGTLNPPPQKLSSERAFALRWVPWLCAYSGARVNEITQLRRQDITNIDGIWVMNITPEAGTVKTDEARSVPLHPHIIEQGFIAVIADRTGPLFFNPERSIRKSLDGSQARKVGEFLATWVRELGVSDPAVQPNHGWRHRFKTLARRHGIDAEIRDVIQGHVPRTEGEAYGGTEIRVKYDAIRRIPPYELGESHNT